MICSTLKTNVANKIRSTTVRVPGMNQLHYSPKAKVELNELAMPGEGFIAMESIPTPRGVLRFLARKNDQAFAKGIYLALRAGDEKNLNKICILLRDGDKLVEAFRDRIIKAAN